MTQAPPRELAGQLYRNARKERENQPDHTGSITVAGVTYRLAAWVKEGASGRYFSLKLTAPVAESGLPRHDPASVPGNPGGEASRGRDGAALAGSAARSGAAAEYQPRTLLPGTYPEPLGRRGGERKPIMDEPIPF